MREKILSVLEKNSKADAKEIAILLGMTEQEVANEIRAMENEGIICGYHTLINWHKVNKEQVVALIEVRLTLQKGQGFGAIAERIAKYPEVAGTYLISGGFDLMVVVSLKSIQEVARFVAEKLSTSEGVLNTATHFVLQKYKDHGAMMAKPKVDERIQIIP